MRDETQAVLDWTACCKYNWAHWFINLENGDDEFIDVEACLFSGIVLSQSRNREEMAIGSGFNLVTAIAIEDEHTTRSLCDVQRSGGICCSSEFVNISKGTEFAVKSLDGLGRMLDGEPYAELVLDEERFLLMPISKLHFFLES